MLRSYLLNIVFFSYILVLGIQDIYAAQNRKLPRFVTIKSSEANARSGPADDCPIEWVYHSQGEPVKVILEYEQWRKIVDVDGQGGWMHTSLLSKKRNVKILKDDVDLFSSNSETSYIKAKLYKHLVCKLKKCKNNWCNIICGDVIGWVQSEYLWGSD